jgi:hypothetical protein
MWPTQLEIAGAVVIPVLFGLMAVTANTGGRGVLAACLSLAVAFLVTERTLAFPPSDVTHWLLYALPVVALVGLIDASLRLFAILRWALISAVALLLVLLLTTSWRQNIHDAGSSWLFIWAAVAGWAVLATLTALATSRRFTEIGGPVGQPPMGKWERTSAVVALGLALAMTAPTLAAAGSAVTLPLRVASLGLPLLAVAASLILMRDPRRHTDLRGIGWVTSMLWCAILLTAHLYYELTWWIGLLLISGPILAGIAGRLLPAHTTPAAFRRGLLCAALTVLPPFTATAISLWKMLAADASDY